MSIKLLIGGSPCTHWSIAQKNNRETTPEGIGWELFKNYLIAKEKFKSDFFLYENNKSAAQAIKDQIATKLGVGVDPNVRFTYINSALVSAQNRQRFYVTNFGDIEQPEDRGIFLKDILETELPRYDRSPCSDLSNLQKQSGQRMMVCEPIGTKTNPKYLLKNFKTPDAKSVTITASSYKGVGTDGMITVAEPVNPLASGKSRCVTAGYANKGSKHILESNYSDNPSKQTWDSVAEPVGYATPVEWDENGKPTKAISQADGKTYPVYEVKDGLITIKGKQYPIKLVDEYYIIRKLTVRECARLQTMPDDYCKAVFNTQAYKALGNGWTAEVIIHLLNHALKDVPRDEEIIVLSLYDGIATGRYCLEQRGFKNVKYYSYEIDEHAITVANDNYPDIVQCGDAFAIRNNEWKLEDQQCQFVNIFSKQNVKTTASGLRVIC